MAPEVLTRLQTIVNVLTSINWSWNDQDCQRIIQTLDLRVISQVGGRTTYAFPNTDGLSVYSSGTQVNFIEIGIDVFCDPELLEPDEYEDKMQEFDTLYCQCADFVALRLNNRIPESNLDVEDFSAIKVAGWNIENAKFLLILSHHDKELPILLSVQLEPPVIA